MKEIKVGLVKGRHDLPVDEYIFEEIKDPSDIEMIEKQAGAWLSSKFNPWTYYKDTTLVIYVTGLTVALVSVIKTMILGGFSVNLDLMHYDKATDKYIRQKIIDLGLIWSE